MIQRPGIAFDRCKPDNVVSLSFENYTVDGIEKLIVENKDFVSVILFIHYSKFLKRWAWEEKLFSKKFLFPQSLAPHTNTNATKNRFESDRTFRAGAVHSRHAGRHQGIAV